MSKNSSRASHRAKSLTVAEAAVLPRIDMPVHENWTARAADLDYEILARVVSRHHLLLRCQNCNGHVVTAFSTLMRNQPRCGGCIEHGRIERARQAGLTLMHRDPDDHHYGLFIADCGHELRRQFGRIPALLANEQLTRCEVCQIATEQQEARRHGWQRLGPDPDGKANYRLYRHRCGHEQRIAVGNMRTRRCACAGCDPGWSAGPSFLYAMAFALPNGLRVTKLGYARDPESRLRYQLKRDRDLPASLLTVVPVASGRLALQAEQNMHYWLRQNYPDQVVDPALFNGVLRVKSEIYSEGLAPVILDLLEQQRNDCS